MTKKSWFVKSSFPVIVFFIPLLILYKGFLAIVPEDQLNSKPHLNHFILGMIGAVVSWIILVIIFTFIWALLMRLIYGVTQARQWIYEDRPDMGILGNSIENLMRKICGLVL